ncbi:MAG: fluoride efflux transporter CrcB [Pseudomonadota bacterium]
MLATLGYVALGGAVGSVLRALVGMSVAFPLGTLTVNVLGSFVIGLAWAAGIDRSGPLFPFLVLGLLGGFTTFSTFSLDTLRLMQDGQVAGAVAYVLGSVTLSLLAALAGLILMGRLS